MRPEVMNIGYTDDLAKPYADSLRRVTDYKTLCSHVATWQMLAPDAFDAVYSKDFSWPEYVDGAKKERKDIYAGDEWGAKYGAILLPEVLMRISILADQYKAPEGCIFIRLRDLGKIEIKEGRARIIE